MLLLQVLNFDKIHLHSLVGISLFIDFSYKNLSGTLIGAVETGIMKIVIATKPLLL